MKTHGSAARGEKIDADSFELEGRLIEMLGQKDWSEGLGLTSYVNIQRHGADVDLPTLPGYIGVSCACSVWIGSSNPRLPNAYGSEDC